MKLLLFTFSYPFGAGEQFLENEIDFLSSKVEELIIIPFKVEPKKRYLPKNVIVDVSLAEALEAKSEFKFYPLFFSLKQILMALRVHPIRNGSAIRDVIGFAHHGRIVTEWANTNLDGDEVLYTYWFERITYGLASYLALGNNHTFITRAHGYDVYEGRRKHSFIPFRKYTLENLDAVFCVSHQGKKYIGKKYGFFDKLYVLHLGTNDNGVAKTEEGEVIRILSCSMIIPLKRVHLIFESVREFSQNHPEFNVEWCHFGDGKLRSDIEDVLQTVPKNLKVELKGRVPNKELLSYYKRNHVSVFINLSISEGLPVTIMEAISFGIPVIATDVGGVSEIVDAENGVLLASNASKKEIAVGIEKVVAAKGLRRGARLKWEKEFVADKNYEKFYQKLTELSH